MSKECLTRIIAAHLALTFAFGVAPHAVAQAAVSRDVGPANAEKAILPATTREISSRTAIIVTEFSVSEKTGWPYDAKQLQSQTVAELRAKSAEHLDVLVGAPATARVHSYTLNGEIIAWRPGNRAKRMVIGMGSGRESAEIHYWLTDESGKRIFDHKDTIRAEFWGNAYEGSVGQLAHPFASKISSRLSEAKLF